LSTKEKRTIGSSPSRYAGKNRAEGKASADARVAALVDSAQKEAAQKVQWHINLRLSRSNFVQALKPTNQYQVALEGFLKKQDVPKNIRDKVYMEFKDGRTGMGTTALLHEAELRLEKLA
jgi:hypothetical protein